jgi:hypothetical protein
LLLPVGQDRHSPSHKIEKSRTAASPKFEFREAGTQISCYNVMPLPVAPPCLPLFIKDLLKEGWEFCFCLLGLYFGLLGFGTFCLAFGFLLWGAFWL